MFIIRFIFYFSLSFFILCLPTGNDTTLFQRLYTMVTPYANKAIKTTKQKLATTKRYSKKLYSNSEPIETDEIKSSVSAIAKKKVYFKNTSPEDSYSEDEKERLQRILSSKDE